MDLPDRALSLANAQLNTAMKDPKHLRQWILSTDRKYAAIDMVDMVDALPWPGGVEAFMQCMSAYTQHRSTQTTGLVEDIEVASANLKGMATSLGNTPKANGRTVATVPVMKGEQLEPAEIDDAILALLRLKNRQVSEHARNGHVDPS